MTADGLNAKFMIDFQCLNTNLSNRTNEDRGQDVIVLFMGEAEHEFLESNEQFISVVWNTLVIRAIRAIRVQKENRFLVFKKRILISV